MNTFHISVKTGSMKFMFEFRKICISTGAKFFVCTVDNQNNCVAFDMKRDKYNNWKITPPAEEWVLSLEHQLACAISENLN